MVSNQIRDDGALHTRFALLNEPAQIVQGVLMASVDDLVAFKCTSMVELSSRQLRQVVETTQTSPGHLFNLFPLLAVGTIVFGGLFKNLFGRHRHRDDSSNKASYTESTPSLSVVPTEYCYGIDERELLVQEQLSSGCCGQIWKAVYKGQVVILKTIRGLNITSTSKTSEKEDLGVFVRDITSLTRAQSPYICNVFGGRYLTNSAIHIVMEYMKLGDLTGVIAAQPPGGSRWDNFINYALDIAQGLCFLHSNGLVHSDLKSANVLLGQISGIDRVGAKLTDVGLTRTQQIDLTLMPQALLNYRWMAPEMFTAEPEYRPSVDVYSFGMILFQMDSGEPPYWSSRSESGIMMTDIMVADCVIRGSIKPKFNSTCPVWIEDLVYQCTNPNWNLRPTAIQVRDSILEHMTSESPDDLPPFPLPTFGSNQNFRHDSSVYNDGGSSVIHVDGDRLHLHVLRPYRVVDSELKAIEQIANGAFGEVWRGTYKDQRVAIKTLIGFQDHTADDWITFIDEIKIMTVLRSRYICQMIGLSWQPSCDIKLVLEYMDGGDLRDYLTKTEQSTKWNEKLLLALDIIEGLCYLHDTQIIHRDLKSRNVLLQNSGRLCAKLTDFGISRYVEQNTMSCGIGTYRWMAPEMVINGHYTVAVDIYSFGMILNELDTHQVPYYGEKTPEGQVITDIGINDKVRRGLLKPRFTSSCPNWIKSLGLRCASMNPNDRPTAQQLRAELKAQMDPSLFE
ncbi:kinase [Thraustotheca clavata]|uniref:Kinase n=1 Tax=Thraustotheca clavata TaxID=74557 RepID=A0A1V9ZHI3_9STRA|nr:kinase [Thraustotheca clavata]